MFSFWKCCKPHKEPEETSYHLLNPVEPHETLEPFEFIKQTSYIIIELMLTGNHDFLKFTPHELNDICLNIITENLDKSLINFDFQNSIKAALKTPNIDKLLFHMELKPELPDDLSFKKLTHEHLNTDYLIHYIHQQYHTLSEGHLYFAEALKKEHTFILNYIRQCYVSLNLDLPLLNQKMSPASLKEILDHFNELTQFFEISDHSYSRFMASHKRISLGLADLYQIQKQQIEGHSTYSFR